MSQYDACAKRINQLGVTVKLSFSQVLGSSGFGL